MERQIEVVADWDSITHLIEFANNIEHELHLSDEQCYFLRLVIEEIATNIVKYGYRDITQGVIQLVCASNDGTLNVVIRDQGHPFDPRYCPEPDMTDDVGARAIGGLGLFLVREFADHLYYHHDAVSGWNELLVVKSA